MNSAIVGKSMWCLKSCECKPSGSSVNTGVYHVAGEKLNDPNSETPLVLLVM